jgi:gliding motility-associated-like protein
MPLSIQNSLCIVLALLFASLGVGQNCPTLITPLANSSNVPVDVTLRWTNPSSEFSTFVLSMGTTPGGNDLVNRRTSGIISSFSPEFGLPEESDIYMSIILIREDQTSIQCNYTFSTKIIEEKPECTTLTTPENGATQVPNNIALSWAYAPRATGYRISMGTTPRGVDLIDNKDLGNQRTFDPPGNLPADQKIYVTLTPYNRLGAAEGCREESFITGNTNIDCEPQRPKIESIPRFVGLCKERGYTDLRVLENADEYLWFQLDFKGQEFPIGTGDSLRVAETGVYRLVAQNKVGSQLDYTPCETIIDFEVIEVGDPIISKIDVTRDPDGLNIQVVMEGSIAYQFALDENGPFQDSPFFRNLPLKPYTLFVKDIYDCGTTSQPIARKLSAADFPAFFTPNGDGNNEIWKYNPPVDLPDAYLEYIQIFDRFGTLLANINPEVGWDGRNTQGRPMQPSVYWFKAVTLTRDSIHGYFALKR